MKWPKGQEMEGSSGQEKEIREQQEDAGKKVVKGLIGEEEKKTKDKEGQ